MKFNGNESYLLLSSDHVHDLERTYDRGSRNSRKKLEMLHDEISQEVHLDQRLR